MQTVTAPEPTTVAARRPAVLDFAAAILLLTTVVLHVVAMAPSYFVDTGSLMSQSDQAASYSILAAAWALALVIGLTGPHRTPVAAALAVGVAVTELGFRVTDTGFALRYGTGTVGDGLWLMDAAWLVGVLATVTAVLAARARHSVPPAPVEQPTPEWDLNPYGDSDVVDGPVPPPAGTAGPAAEPIVPDDDEDPHERMAWTLLVVVLAAVVAGAFLPAWSTAVAVSTQTSQTVTRSLGNAFDSPWQQIVGSVLAALALLVVPVVGVRLRNKAVGAAAAVGALLVLATQLVAPIVEVGQPVPPIDFGISSAQARDLGLSLSMKLTSWFTLDALAAYALFAAVMVWATLRVVHDSSPGTTPSAP